MSRRILLVDDEPATADAVADRLRSDGYEVPVVHEGLAAVAYCGATPPRLDERRVTLGDDEIALTATEFDLLAVLATKPGCVFSRADLLAGVWGYPEGIPARRSRRAPRPHAIVALPHQRVERGVEHGGSSVMEGCQFAELAFVECLAGLAQLQLAALEHDHVETGADELAGDDDPRCARTNNADIANQGRAWFEVFGIDDHGAKRANRRGRIGGDPAGSPPSCGGGLRPQPRAVAPATSWRPPTSPAPSTPEPASPSSSGRPGSPLPCCWVCGAPPSGQGERPTLGSPRCPRP